MYVYIKVKLHMTAMIVARIKIYKYCLKKKMKRKRKISTVHPEVYMCTDGKLEKTVLFFRIKVEK